MGWRLTLIASLLLTSCLAPGPPASQTFSSCQESEIVLFPHHLLVEDYIREMYESLEASEKIIIISPNHFSTGYPAVAPANDPFGYIPHEEFAQEYFPKAEIEGWMIKVGASEESLTWLTSYLAEQSAEQSATIIFSIDFSHYLPGEVAYLHDLRSIDVIESREIESALSLEVDSPESVKVMLQLLAEKNLSMDVLKNTNPSWDTGIEFFENTTHVFGCSASTTPQARQLHLHMDFAHSEEHYLGLSEEDRYLYGYDTVSFNQGSTDTATITHSDKTTDIYIFDYFN
jgi:hypothetical protein